jgi:flagellar FliJ protein
LRFRFPFEKIVDLKSNEKTQAEWMLTSAISTLRNEETSLQQLQEQRHSLYNSMLNSSTQRTSISRIKAMHDYMEHLDQQIYEKNQDVSSAEAAVSVQRDSLSEKIVDEKVWCKSRAKAYTKFVMETRKREQAELDDLTAVRRLPTP